MRAGHVACHQAHVDGVGTGEVPVGSGQRCGLGVLDQRGDGGGSPGGVGVLRGRALRGQGVLHRRSIGRGSGHHGDALGGQRSHGQVELDFIGRQHAAGIDLGRTTEVRVAFHLDLDAHRRTLRGDLQLAVDVHVGAMDVGADDDVGRQVLLRARARGAIADLVLGLHAAEVDVGGDVRAGGAEGVGRGGSEGGRRGAQRQDGECEGVQGTGHGIGSCKTKKQWMKTESRRDAGST